MCVVVCLRACSVCCVESGVMGQKRRSRRAQRISRRTGWHEANRDGTVAVAGPFAAGWVGSPCGVAITWTWAEPHLAHRIAGQVGGPAVGRHQAHRVLGRRGVRRGRKGVAQVLPTKVGRVQGAMVDASVGMRSLLRLF